MSETTNWSKRTCRLKNRRVSVLREQGNDERVAILTKRLADADERKKGRRVVESIFVMSREAAAAVYLLLRQELTIKDLYALELDSDIQAFKVAEDEASS